MTAVPQAIANGPMPYRRRRPERTLLYRTVQTYFATWLALQRDGCADGDPVPAHVEREFRRYLECGILAHGFARARCGECGHDFLIAFSCKGRGVCPSCNARRMVETAAHLTDHVFTRLPLRQWVLAAPKRRLYFLQRDPDLQGAALRAHHARVAARRGSPSTRRCASRPTTTPVGSACCATAPGRRSPWTGSAHSIPNACSTTAPSPAPAAAAHCA